MRWCLLAFRLDSLALCLSDELCFEVSKDHEDCGFEESVRYVTTLVVIKGRERIQQFEGAVNRQIIGDIRLRSERNLGESLSNTAVIVLKT